MHTYGCFVSQIDNRTENLVENNTKPTEPGYIDGRAAIGNDVKQTNRSGQLKMPQHQKTRGWSGPTMLCTKPLHRVESLAVVGDRCIR